MRLPSPRVLLPLGAALLTLPTHSIALPGLHNVSAATQILSSIAGANEARKHAIGALDIVKMMEGVADRFKGKPLPKSTPSPKPTPSPEPTLLPKPPLLPKLEPAPLVPSFHKHCYRHRLGEDKIVFDYGPDMFIPDWEIAERYARVLCRGDEFKFRYAWWLDAWDDPNREYDPNSHEIEVRPPGPNYTMRDAPNCESKFIDGLINGCDGNDPDNPFNRKFGGELSEDGWTFIFRPLQSQALVSSRRPRDNFLVHKLNYIPLLANFMGYKHPKGIKRTEFGWPNYEHVEAKKCDWGDEQHYEVAPMACCKKQDILDKYHSSGQCIQFVRWGLGNNIWWVCRVFDNGERRDYAYPTVTKAYFNTHVQQSLD